MSESTLNVLFGGLMGFFGGLFTIPINAFFSHTLKRDELYYAHKLEVIAKERELLLQHRLEIEKREKTSEITELVCRVEQLESRLSQ